MNWSVLTAVITAGAAVAAVFYTGRSLDATRDQVVIAQRQNEVAQQGQYTDRYGKAVEQLDKAGADHLQGRLGGVYALERLARDSPRDQPTIIEVLSAFIRTTAPAPTAAQPPDQGLFAGPWAGVCPDQPVSSDVQAAVTVLGRRKTENDNKTPVNLSGACLRNADLDHADLAGADLGGTNLAGADLGGTNLAGANLTGAYLDHAYLRGANLGCTNLRCTNLDHADLGGANLIGANLTGAYLDQANLIGANLISATLIAATLTRANLGNANLTGANLTRANLTRANLTSVLHDNNTFVVDAVKSPETVGAWW